MVIIGFFSWKCAVTDVSIANIYSGRIREQSKCYLITPTKTYYEPAYEGYGVFGGADVYELLGNGDRDNGIDLYFREGGPPFDVKVVLAQFYNGQTYEELPPSKNCPHQGYFF